MKEHLLEIKIVQPGRPTGQYFALDPDTLRLDKVIYPKEILPFDVGILPTALNEFHEPLGVLVLGQSSHPINTEMESRLLGALQRDGESPVLIVAPNADELAPGCLNDLSSGQRAEMVEILKRSYPGEWNWLTTEAVEPVLHTAVIRYRQRADRGNGRTIDPDWKPLHIGRPKGSFADLDLYTPAEYTFFELPHRFQQYVGDSLAPEERILNAARRPAMASRRHRSWLRREQLQEGVLILTNQRLIHLTELVPPDSANIRYGFHTLVGVVERLARISISGPGAEALLLSTTWRAIGGEIVIEWEMPRNARSSLEELASLLEGFIVDDPDACLLRRATTPAIPEKLPALRDSAANDLDSHLPLNEHFSKVLREALRSNERAHAWALLPEWLDRRKGAQVLVVTNQRVFLLGSDPFEVALNEISTLEYTGSILESSIAINHVQDVRQRRRVIPFPYPGQDAFRTCFEAARRCMAVVPLVHRTVSLV
jgi:hypothetical protein